MEWINVNKKMPKISFKKVYIVLFDNGEINLLSRPFDKAIGWSHVTHWMKTPKNDQWINAKKRLPTTKKDVFVMLRGGLIVKTILSHENLKNDFTGTMRKFNTIRWIPLPKPPKNKKIKKGTNK